MARRNKDTVWGIILAALIVLGLAQSILSGQWSGLLIGVIVLGAIFLLYKFPPGRSRAPRSSIRSKQAARPSRSAKPRTRSSKTMPFKVIEGGKDDDQFPRYH
ncbi:hypothetical protein [Paenibacillus xylaniclasticus]|uniref:hypothetical protein n=1 Tax=Paenibacillus xylaniclasticus TaxID=588083 RepID=UPI000FD9B0AA|nr:MULTISPECIES: hypothetical protein [Paenibacillus]GFN30526.1 hypothetical protein PCURB6_07860 [Paenibacillus curdlanolyticus]